MAAFVGRVAELHLLERRMALTAQGRGQLVSIVGEPGIGKSRLLYEFRQTLPPSGVTYLEGQCVSYGAGAPFLPIIDVVRAACAVAETDAPDVVSDKVHRALGGLSLNPEDSAPFLIHLLGGSPGQRLAGLSPEVVAARTLQAFVMVSLSLSRRQPLVVAIEDLHWIDRSSEAYLAALAEHLVGARILLLLTYRPAERPAFADRSDATKIGLPPLTPDEVASIARSVLGAAVAEDAARLIANRAGGNPLFAEELTMALAESETAPAAMAEAGAVSPLPSLIDGPRESRSPSTTASARWSRLTCWWASLPPTDRRSRGRRSRCRRPSMLSWPPESIDSLRKTRPCSRWPPSSARTCRIGCSAPLPRDQSRSFVEVCSTCRPPSSCTRRGSIRTSSTRSGTP